MFGLKYTLCLLACLYLLTAALPGQELNVAILDFETTGISKIEGKTITNYFRSELFKTRRFTIIERNELNKIMMEQTFQQTDCVDAACAVKIGRMAAVDKMFLGGITSIGGRLIIEVRLIDIMEGVIELIETAECTQCSLDQAVVLVGNLAARVADFVGVRGRVSGVSGQLAYIDLGTMHGLTPGMLMDAYGIEEVKDEAGKILMRKKKVHALLQLMTVGEKASEGKTLDGAVEKGMYVRLNKTAPGRGSGDAWFHSPWVRYGLLAGGAVSAAVGVLRYQKGDDLYNNEYSAAAESGDAELENKYWQDIKSYETQAGILLGLSGALLIGGGVTFAF